MPLNFPDFLTHANPAYPVVRDSDMQGGYVAVADVAARNAIPLAKRKAGMAVSCVIAGQRTVRQYASADLSNTQWTNAANWLELGKEPTALTGNTDPNVQLPAVAASAFYQCGSVGGNNDLVFTAKNAGSAGNTLSVMLTSVDDYAITMLPSATLTLIRLGRQHRALAYVDGSSTPVALTYAGYYTERAWTSGGIPPAPGVQRLYYDDLGDSEDTPRADLAGYGVAAPGWFLFVGDSVFYAANATTPFDVAEWEILDGSASFVEVYQGGYSAAEVVAAVNGNSLLAFTAANAPGSDGSGEAFQANPGIVTLSGGLPARLITPTYVGQLYRNTLSNTWYRAISTTAAPYWEADFGITVAATAPADKSKPWFNTATSSLMVWVAGVSNWVEASGNVTSVFNSPTPPPPPHTAGDAWFDTDDNVLAIWKWLNVGQTTGAWIATNRAELFQDLLPDGAILDELGAAYLDEAGDYYTITI